MSAAQLEASERFIQAMGSMVNDEEKVKQVILYILSLQSQSTISQERFDSLRSIDDLDAHLEVRIRNHYQRVEA